MRVVQSVAGVFHHFQAAKQLQRRGWLERLYTSFPWRRVAREGVARDKVETWPWLHAPYMLAGRHPGLVPQPVMRQLLLANFIGYDRWVAGRLPACDLVFALSAAGLATGRNAQERGAAYVCDRASSHARYQDAILREEFERWGIRQVVVEPRVLARELAEYEAADAITVPSEFAARSFAEMGVPPDKVFRVPFGVQLDRFYPEGAPEPDRFDILFGGQVSYRKGVVYLLQAFAQLKHPNKRLLLAGAVQPSFRPVLERSMTAGVEVLGAIRQPEMRRRMSTSHVFVLPSVEDGFGYVLAEAMACGCPCIASVNTGGSDLITDGVEGFLVPIRSPEALLERLSVLADDTQLRQRMAEASLRRVQSLGGWDSYGEALANVFTEVRSRRST